MIIHAVGYVRHVTLCAQENTGSEKPAAAAHAARVTTDRLGSYQYVNELGTEMEKRLFVKMSRI